MLSSRRRLALANSFWGVRKLPSAQAQYNSTLAVVNELRKIGWQEPQLLGPGAHRRPENAFSFHRSSKAVSSEPAWPNIQIYDKRTKRGGIRAISDCGDYGSTMTPECRGRPQASCRVRPSSLPKITINSHLTNQAR
jgi:hypothetical protein